jgi:hypothetical protein
MIEFLNNFFAPLYENHFDFQTNKVFLDCVFSNYDYAKFGGVLIMTSFVLLFIFYKIWDPLKNQRLNWIFIIFIIALTCSITTYIFLVEFNVSLRMLLKGYNGSGTDPLSFVFIISLISFFLGLIASIILSIPLSLLSSYNRYNPF